MSSNYLQTKTAHGVLFQWGNAGSGKVGSPSYYSLSAQYGKNNFIVVEVKKLIKNVKTARDFYVSISDRGNARFSMQAAEDCAKFVRKQIRANIYSNIVPKLTKEWSAEKKRKGLFYQVGMATEEMVNNISAFRTNIRDHALKENKHTGYVVGINRQGDFEESTINKDVQKKINSSKPKKKNMKRRNPEPLTRKTHGLTRHGSLFLNAKLYWLEHGRKNAKNRQPPRPVYTKAVEDYIRTHFKDGIDFVGQLKLDSNGNLAFKFKHHR